MNLYQIAGLIFFAGVFYATQKAFQNSVLRDVKGLSIRARDRGQLEDARFYRLVQTLLITCDEEERKTIKDRIAELLR